MITLKHILNDYDEEVNPHSREQTDLLDWNVSGWGYGQGVPPPPAQPLAHPVHGITHSSSSCTVQSSFVPLVDSGNVSDGSTLWGTSTRKSTVTGSVDWTCNGRYHTSQRFFTISPAFSSGATDHIYHLPPILESPSHFSNVRMLYSYFLSSA